MLNSIIDKFRWLFSSCVSVSFGLPYVASPYLCVFVYTILYIDPFSSMYFSFQMVSEKVGGAEGTKLDEDFKDLERVRGKSEPPLAGDRPVYSCHFK